MLYRFLHFILRFWLRIHFRRLFIRSLENVPKSGAAILACNHPNSFLDAIVVALVLKRKIHFLVRSDVFRKPRVAALLQKMNMIPIYRLEEGNSNLGRNDATFSLCFELLKRGELILIFSEGNCVVEKRLRTLKKGTARIWFGAMDYTGWEKDIAVIPVGINYTKPYYFRTELMLNFGAPCPLHSLKEIWQSEPAKAIRLFNECLFETIQRELLIIPDHAADEGAEVILDVFRSQTRHPMLRWYYPESARFEHERELLLRLHAQHHAKQLYRDAENFGKGAHKLGIRLEYLDAYISRWQSIFLLLGFIPALAGALIHFLPYWISMRSVRKTKFHPKFRSSVLFGSAALSSYLFYIVSTALLMIIDIRWATVILTFPFLAWLTVNWTDQLIMRRTRIQTEIIRRKMPEITDALRHTRDTLLLESGALNLSPAKIA
ncbi:MAG: 1-acyl-sn-glycerol-3-phosphate acyltransferase [Bacteroidia bacterium]